MAKTSQDSRTRAKYLLGISAAVLIAALISIFSSRASREIERLPAAERRALYQRTLEALRTSCTQATGPILTEYCQEQATFIQRFPECNPECQALTERFEPPPSR